MPYKDKEKQKIASRKYYQKHKKKCNENSKRWRKNNPERMKFLIKRYKNRIKNRAFNILGNKCVRCDETDWRCLQIDHINNNGAEEKRILGNDCQKIYRRVIEHPEDYQILCANHNWIKRYENLIKGGKKNIKTK